MLDAVGVVGEPGDYKVGVSYEHDLSVFIHLRETEQDTIWLQADLAVEMTAKWGRKTASMLAHDVGLSAAYVRQMIAASKAFPAEKRAPDISFSIHRVAAMTEDPDKWLVAAIEHSYSDRELRRAVKDAKDGVTANEEARSAEERLERAVLKYNENYSASTGKTVSLVWTQVKEDAA